MLSFLKLKYKCWFLGGFVNGNDFIILLIFLILGYYGLFSIYFIGEGKECLMFIILCKGLNEYIFILYYLNC